MSAQARAAFLQEQFESPEKQAHAARLGMWVFLSTEILLFSGLFVAYGSYRAQFPLDFERASRLLKIDIGTANTFILLTSSFFVALSMHFVRGGRSRLCAAMIGAAILLGFAFMALKAIEYRADIVEGLLPGRYLRVPEVRTPGAAVFYSLYWIATGLHALHVTVGLSVLLVVASRAWRGAYGPAYHTPVELGGMYWHLVDTIWIFLWPLLYLL
jgi:cytochrome c oxidase subunit 3